MDSARATARREAWFRGGVVNTFKVGIERLRLRHPFTISRGTQEEVSVVITELEADGLRGYGEASPSSFYGENAAGVLAALERERGFIERADLERYHHVLEEAAERFDRDRGALCAFDLAVHDQASRRLGAPLWRLLGLDRSRIPPSSFTIGLSTTEHMVEKAREASAYPIFKIKLGTKPDRDLDIVRALRRASTAAFRVDANCAWTPTETIEKSAELASLGVEFIEQPLPPGELDAMERVFRESRLPIVADENSVVPSDVPRLVGRFHGINIKLVKCGGLQPALRMVHTARTLGLRVMYGCMIESAVAITAAAQIGALADWLDLDGNLLIASDPFRGATMTEGAFDLPDGWVERRDLV
jgi:L-alanine-DL-glutamate epimerase-like enolase superfamily enzyme